MRRRDGCVSLLCILWVDVPKAAAVGTALDTIFVGQAAVTVDDAARSAAIRTGKPVASVNLRLAPRTVVRANAGSF